MLKPKTRWRIEKPDEQLVQALADQLSITPLVASLLVKRGLCSADEAREFLYIEKQAFHDPYLMKDMAIAVERIQEAIQNNEKILVYGDYDADGVSSTTVLLTTLRRLGADAEYYIPNRFTEGYGPNEKAFRWAYENDYKLIITVDTGIAAVHEAAVAKQLGMDLIITDHHEPGPELPEAVAIIHPKQEGCKYPYKELAGVGVAFKLSHALLNEVPEDLLEVVAIGTIADLVPLQGENRLLVKKGLAQLKQTRRTGLNALIKAASIKKNEINEETVGFSLAPRINAVGRLQSADLAVDLFFSDNEEEALEIAYEIDHLNKERQKLVSMMAEEAIKEVEDCFPIEENPVLVIARENWNAGVVGIVASRLVERFCRPTIVLSIDKEKGIAKGSARSIQGFDLFKNLSSCRDILPHFGGHTLAAGMTLALENVDSLRERLIVLANEQLTEEDFIPVTNIDIFCKIEDITVDSVEEMQMLAPYGMDNRKPVVQIEDVKLASIRKIGADQAHIKIVFEEDGNQLDCVGFGFGFIHDEISPVATLSAIGELSINEWNNFRKPQLMLHDISVNEWQLFDYRGARDMEKIFATIPQEKRLIISFDSKVYNRIKKSFPDETRFIENLNDIEGLNISGKYIIFADIPKSFDLLASLFRSGVPERIYTFFQQEADHFFSTIPTREHFKWYYGFLLKKAPFDLEKNGEKLAHYKGWTEETIEFMSKVFFELEFVKIEDGIISVNASSAKRDLSESRIYAEKQQQIELEKTLLYTSYGQLKQWFHEKLELTEQACNV
ncbi:single-stranded-DNA-specific exonuclease RecJ [Metabacillus fastidiosus]|uniref:single-stranded-DNA-specific exonuclease RecJ n=1 Tax=Metabacillus fastidiosus TaxID=1458 RepID=UPI003D276597